MRKTTLKRSIPLHAKTPLRRVQNKLQSTMPLKRLTRLKPISERKVQELNDQVTIRVFLCIRCGGSAAVGSRMTVGGKLTTVKCVGGKCEICKKPAPVVGQLEPHELISRSLGGLVSWENSLMVCRSCHEKDQLLPVAERLLGAYERQIYEPNLVED